MDVTESGYRCTVSHLHFASLFHKANAHFMPGVYCTDICEIIFCTFAFLENYETKPYSLSKLFFPI